MFDNNNNYFKLGKRFMKKLTNKVKNKHFTYFKKEFTLSKINRK